MFFSKLPPKLAKQNAKFQQQFLNQQKSITAFVKKKHNIHPDATHEMEHIYLQPFPRPLIGRHFSPTVHVGKLFPYIRRFWAMVLCLLLTIMVPSCHWGCQEFTSFTRMSRTHHSMLFFSQTWETAEDYSLQTIVLTNCLNLIWIKSNKTWKLHFHIIWIYPPPSNSGKWRFIGIPY